MFDYEKLLYDSLLVPDFYNSLQHIFKQKHLWVNKATGLGVTEFYQSDPFIVGYNTDFFKLYRL
jgi:hypothetical protein